MFATLIHFAANDILDIWALLVAHVEVAIPGAAVLLGAMAAVNRKNRAHS